MRKNLFAVFCFAACRAILHLYAGEKREFSLRREESAAADGGGMFYSNCSTGVTATSSIPFFVVL